MTTNTRGRARRPLLAAIVAGGILAGGPAEGGHFDADIAPGASFCNSQSKAPGFHVPE